VTSFFLLLIQCETCNGWHFAGKFCMPHSLVKFYQEWEGELTPFRGPLFLNSTNTVTRSCQAASSATPCKYPIIEANHDGQSSC
jgi:hypothetical protein